MAAWLPTNATTALALWIDPSDSSTVTLNGSTVDQINDKSGNGYNFVKRGTTGPSFTTVNGLNALSGSGDTTAQQTAKLYSTVTGLNNLTNGANTYAAIAARNSGQTTIVESAFCVTDPTATAPTNRVYGWVANTGSTGRAVYRHGATSTTTTTTITTTGSVSIQTRSGTAIAGYLDGTSIATASNGASFTAPTGGHTINGWYVSSGNGFLAPTWTGDCIIYSDALSTDDRQKLEGYLAWKWGAQANLPAGHPYKNGPPQIGGAKSFLTVIG